MTEKRYKLSEPNGAYLIDNDRPYAHWINDDDKIIDLLNDLVGENEQLKSICQDHRDHAIDFKADCIRLEKENEQLKQQLSDIRGQLVMLDNCDNWDYTRMKHTVREIAEIIGYNGTINPKRR